VTGFAGYGLPPLAWMALIWGFSSDIGSADHTAGIFGWIASLLLPWATPAQVALLHGLVRKLAHVTEYAILAALWFRALHGGRGLASAPSALAALGISIGWAIADELHQALVPSRTGSPLDVLVDATGAALGIVVLYVSTGRPAMRRTLPVVPTPHPSD
jgi:VanZ family protein